MDAHGQGVQHCAVVVPEDIKLTGAKLVFRAFFNEAVTDSRTEKYRSRVITIVYFLEDDTTEMYELARMNDGLPAGKFLQRMQHPALSLDTLRVGGTVTVYGRTLRIVACDERTRKFYDDRGEPQEPNETIPDDDFMQATRKEAERGSLTALSATRAIDKGFAGAGASSRGDYGKKQNPMKRYMEAIKGGRSAVRDTLRSFLEHSDTALEFYVTWDDRGSDEILGSKKYLVLRYHVATDEVEIFYKKGCDDGMGALFFKKDRLPKFAMAHDDRARSCEDGDGSEDYFHWTDLRVGEEIRVLGRTMVVTKCTPATQRFYADHLGLDQNAREVVEVHTKEPTPRRPVPPPTGFGGEEDSLASTKSLMPRVPVDNRPPDPRLEGKALRYDMVLDSDDPIDKIRRFQLSYFLADKSMSVYEQGVPNTGIPAGKFARRDKHKNPATGKVYEASELFLDAKVTVQGFRFRVTHADDFSLGYMESNSGLWPQSSFEFAMSTLKKKMHEKSSEMRKMFRKFDDDKSGSITYDEFQKMLEYYGMYISRAEMVTIMRRLDGDGSGSIGYAEFMQAFADHDDEVGFKGADMRVSTPKSDHAPEGPLDDYDRKVAALEHDEHEARATEQLLQGIARQMKASRGSKLHEVFRRFDDNKDHTVDRREFRAAMGDEGLGFSPEQVGLLERRFFAGGKEECDYRTFMKLVHTYADRPSV